MRGTSDGRGGFRGEPAEAAFREGARLLALADISEYELEALGPQAIAYLKWQSEWTQTARPNQIPPEVDPKTGEPWLEFGAMSGRGWGKALDIDTPVPVPSGWRAMRDIKVGDKVVGSDGSLVNVTFVSPVMIDRECYRIVWNDGAEIVADAEHQWSARSRADRRAGRGWRVVTTQEMVQARQRVGGERQWQTPGPPVARFGHADLPVDPWLLGFWLGDSAGSMLTVGRGDRDEVLALCEQAGRTYREAAGENRYTCAAASWGTRCAATGQYTLDDSFSSALRQLGLLRNKHIPVVYKRAAVEQRERLLAGLVDSDGYVEHATGRIEITTTRRALADDIAEVARSLGHRARVSEERAMLDGRDVGPKHRVRWTARKGGGLLARKCLGDRSQLGQPDRISTRYIDRIERVESRPVRCIAVDAPDHLYVAGRDWIVTHNTRVGAEWLARAAYEDAEGLPSAVVCPTYGDVKKVAFGGPSGLLAVIPPELVVDYNKSDFMLTIRNVAGGTSLIQGFSSEKPEGLRGPNHARAWCFAAGTPVLMADGSERPIENIRPGEVVTTRYGPRRVLASGRSANPNSRLTIEFGETRLTCTDDHPILTARGWLAAGALREGDELWSVSGTPERHGGNDLTDISTTDASGNCCTAASSRTISDPSRTVTASTTKTTTEPTTTLPTLASCRRGNTPATTTPAAYGQMRADRNSASASWRSRRRDLLRCSCAFSAASLTNIAPLLRRAVSAALGAWTCTDDLSSAARSGSARNAAAFSARSGPPIGSAQRDATGRTRPAVRPSTGRRNRASPVERRSRQSATTPSIAPGLALSKVPVRRLVKSAAHVSVYDLTIEDVHEFIAAGIVVHNCDEVAAWQNDQDTWDMLEMTLRLGTTPQILWTSTPKPRTLIRNISAPKPGRIIVTGSTYENKANLAPSFLKKITVYEGTKLGEQELHAKLMDAEESGIVKRSQFRIWPHDRPLPVFDLIIVSLDTAFTERTRAKDSDAATDTMKGDPDPTACTVWGVFKHEKRSNIMLLDCWDEHLGLPELIRRCKREMQARYGDDSGPIIKPIFGPATSDMSGRKPDILLIEDKGSGISLRQMLEQEGVIAYPYNPGRADKLTRLHIVSPVFARRLVWLPESSNPSRKGQPVNWCETMLAQLCSFTGTGSIKHDDYVDSTSQCLRLCMDKGFLSAQVPAHEQRQAREESEVKRQLRRPGYNPYAS